MYSTMNYSVPEKKGELRDFNDIFLGIVKKRVESSCCGVHPSHAGIVPVAADFFREMVPKSENPVKVLENSFTSQSPFLPGMSLVSTPTNSDRPYFIQRERRRWDSDYDTKMFLKINGTETSINRVDWARVFGQIPSAALIVAEERKFNPVITIPSFDGRFPNYFKDLIFDSMPEGLKVGTVLIDGHVGEYCGKHSDGGMIVVNGSTGQNLGDVSNGVTYIVKDFAGKPTQVENCNFYVGLGFRGRDFGDEIKDFELDKLREKGCKIDKWTNFKKDAFKKKFISLEKMLAINPTQSQQSL